MRLWWLPSPAALIPAGYKQEGRRKVTNSCNGDKSLSRKARIRCQVQGVFFKMGSPATEAPWEHNHNVVFPRSIRSDAAQLMITKQRPPPRRHCCQMCFPPSYQKCVSQTWSELTAELVVQVQIHRSSSSVHTYCPLPALIDTLIEQLETALFFIDEALYRKDLTSCSEGALRD